MKQFQIQNEKYNAVEKFKLNKDVQLIVTKKSKKLKNMILSFAVQTEVTLTSLVCLLCAICDKNSNL